MSPELASRLARHRISFMHGPESTSLGYGATRLSLDLEPFVQFRGGRVDAKKIGAFTYLGCPQSEFRHIASIGRFCSIGPGVVTGLMEHCTRSLSTHSMFSSHWARTWPELQTEFGWTDEQYAKGRESLAKGTASKAARIVIGNDVWIGAGAFISRGVKIGDGAVVAARAVVTKDVAPYAVIGGAPAKFIRQRFDDSTVDRLLRIRWWDYGPAIVAGLDWTSPERCLDLVEARIAAGAHSYAPMCIRIAPDDAVIVVSPEATMRRLAA